jgi:hypothetical protein
LLPVALAAAAGGGVWLPPGLAAAWQGASGAAALAAGSLGLELVWRGLALGGLGPAFQGRARGVPVLLAAALHAATLAVLPSSAAAPGGPLAGAGAALVFGLAAGFARQRAESLAPPLLFASLGLAARLALLAADGAI